MDWIKVALALFLLVSFPLSLYLVGKSIYHTWKMISNLTGKYAMFYGGLLLFMPGQFNADGNGHRIKLLNTLKWLLPLLVFLFGTQFVLTEIGRKL